MGDPEREKKSPKSVYLDILKYPSDRTLFLANSEGKFSVGVVELFGGRSVVFWLAEEVDARTIRSRGKNVVLPLSSSVHKTFSGALQKAVNIVQDWFLEETGETLKLEDFVSSESDVSENVTQISNINGPLSPRGQLDALRIRNQLGEVSVDLDLEKALAQHPAILI